MDSFVSFLDEFRLVDVDGVVLDNPNDYIEVYEPEGYDVCEISLSRSEDHGFDFEFSDPETPLTFDRVKHENSTISPYDLIKALYESNGVDAKCFFEHRLIGQTPELQYRGRLSFSIRLENYKYVINSRRVNLDDLFRTRQEVQVNFSDDENVDGNAITAPSTEETFLHSKIRKYETQFDYRGGAPSFPSGVDALIAETYEDINTFYCNFGMTDTTSVENSQGAIEIIKNGIQSFTSTFPTIGSEPYPFFQLNDGGKLTIHRVQFNAEIRHLNNGGGDVSFALYYQVGKYGAETMIAGTETNLTGVSGYVESVIYDESDIEINIPIPSKGYTSDFYLYMKIVESNATTDLKKITAPDPFDDYPLTLDATFYAVGKGSLADTYEVKETLNHVLESITGQNNLVVSSFLDDDIEIMRVCNGAAIRGLDNPLVVSFKRLFHEWLKQMYGLGLAVEETATDTFKIVIEKYTYFYQDKFIMHFDNIEDGSFEIAIDESLIFNEIVTGFENYPDANDENKGNNIDEYNTRHLMTTPIQQVKKKASYISRVIGSGYKIENQRLEQFKDNPSETVTDDDNIFCIKCVNNDTYRVDGDNVEPIYAIIADGVNNTLSILGTYFDIREGDTLEVDLIGGSSGLEGTYSVERVSIVGDRFLISVDDVPVSSSSSPNYNLTVQTDRLRAERNELIDNIENVISPETIYNIGLNPRTFLFNQARIINSGLNYKTGSDKIKIQEVNLNGNLAFDFNGGEGHYVDGYFDPNVQMKDDLTLDEIVGFNRLFTGNIIRWSTRTFYSTILYLKQAMMNQSTEDINYGYVTINDDDGVLRKVFLSSIKYKVFDGEIARFEGREKYDNI